MSADPSGWSPPHDAGSRTVRVRMHDGGAALEFEVRNRHNYGPRYGPEANIELTGAVRFDGCMNMNTTDCIHACGPDELLDIAGAVRWVYAQAALRLADYCGDVLELDR